MAGLGAFCLAIIALTRGEPVNAGWLVVASVCIYCTAYRFYGFFVAKKVLGIDATGRRRRIVTTTVGEMSLVGVVLLLAALTGGRGVSETPELAAWFNLTGSTLALMIIGYGFVASVLPVWLLLAPRDYLSTFLKIGTITLLAIGIIIVRPDLGHARGDALH